MTPYEIMLSESQERMIFVMKQEDVEAAMEICRKYELPAAVIGEVTDTGRMVVEEKGRIIADLPAELLADPPVVEERPESRMNHLRTWMSSTLPEGGSASADVLTKHCKQEMGLPPVRP